MSPSDPIGAPRAVLVTGATGMIGSALAAFLESRGDRVYRVTRSPRGPRDIAWNPGAGELDLSAVEPLAAAVHLAAENLAARRWTPSQKKRILESRAAGTRLLSEKLASLASPPPVLVSASGAHIYGDGVPGTQDEGAPHGRSFLSEVCEAWEAATTPAEKAGIRVVHLRLAMVLSPRGGALGKMLPVFKAGLGGPLGSGRQRMNWIALEDVVAIVAAAIADDRYRGPVNAVAPEVVTNLEFTRALGKALHRPALLPAPAFALRLAFGELADGTLLSDVAAEPARLRELGYEFRHPELAPALEALLGSPADRRAL